ncbi:16S rRNA (guanine(966)-N(2))-methyltransferase RsmD [Desulfatitalea alkaliphila]|uniref:16S rRNA (Guanine(966)-N(2))-methyltransferase RsmD n=1 Tax=Desulfatitalea alkaliphila TaxID=2929485 RepID=A0AA41R8R8_9BACT|nr:16S rRNA (guanine(966)-N(2))-methyltransferase RsmD [Desulfatitalea alkaliphila]
MRIIGGTLRGRKLATVRGSAIRPTADRVREALFNILGVRAVTASHVLDLFAGTGAMGMEALSRGARQAVFVDRSAAAIALLRRNLAICRLEACSRVIQWNIAQNLNPLRAYPRTFDLVFMDPPYGQGLIAPCLERLAACGALATGAVIVVEHSPDEALGAPPPGLTRIDFRRYGRTAVTLFLVHEP